MSFIDSDDGLPQEAPSSNVTELAEKAISHVKSSQMKVKRKKRPKSKREYAKVIMINKGEYAVRSGNTLFEVITPKKEVKPVINTREELLADRTKFNRMQRTEYSGFHKRSEWIM